MPPDTAIHSSRLYQLLALGFAHPVEEFHQLLAEGSYGQALGATASVAGIEVQALASPPLSFADLEAGYIALFQVGRRGKPVVPLNAGEYATLNKDEASRPEFLLRYSDWYRHFGLRTDQEEEANELPDHLVCQLEFLAWLGHLEAGVADDNETRQGYRRAQRDFMQRHLQPFLQLLAQKLQGQQGNPAEDFYQSLATLALVITDARLQGLEAATDRSNDQTEHDDSDQIDAVNLWG